MPKIVDLSHRLHTGMPTYPGDRPVPKVETIEKNGLFISSIRLSTHMGTHVDAPKHFFSAGKSLGEISPDKFIGKALCLDKFGAGAEIDLSEDDIGLLDRIKPDWVLLYTGHSRLWGNETYFSDHPYPSVSLIKTLIKMNVCGLGVDFPSIDSASAEKDDYPVHHLWLGAGRLAIENLCELHQLPNKTSVDIFALSLNIDTDGAPARVIAIL
ncbi:MAG: cyclase family protein [Candidatus Marinimicrobia bacterium]|nr:cyclase family protein [Candidatus Neomarinimicrobiota bacterium]